MLMSWILEFLNYRKIGQAEKERLFAKCQKMPINHIRKRERQLRFSSLHLSAASLIILYLPRSLLNGGKVEKSLGGKSKRKSNRESEVEEGK